MTDNAENNLAILTLSASRDLVDQEFICRHHSGAELVLRLVRTLIAGAARDAGRNEVIWNGRNDSERAVASGDQAHGRITLVK